MSKALARKETSSSPLQVVQDQKEETVIRYRDGWRAGKPVEDPEKLKKWGFINANPSEYLICVKGGKINPRRSGQGAHIFKWPWESVAIVPTTFQKIDFVADQITLERIGVRVSGIAVFRIVEPTLAYRVLNFSYSERASEKLSFTLREMFVGAARRLIANLSLDECLTKRKEAIARFLMDEIAPVVSGRGAAGDVTDRGWGVVLDTIEIQNVLILSEQVFNDLQAPYRSEIATRAELADLDRKRLVAERQAETDRKMAEVKLAAERETRMLRARTEAEAAEIEANEALRAEQARARITAGELERKELLARKRIEVEKAISVQELEQAARITQTRSEFDQDMELRQIAAIETTRRARAQADLAALAAERELTEEKHKVEARRLEQARQDQLFALDTENQLQEARARAAGTRRVEELEVIRKERAGKVEHERAMAEIEQLLMEQRVLHDLVTTGLPQIASAFQQSFGTIHYTQLDSRPGEGSPFGMVTSAFGQVLAVAKSFGLDPEKLKGRDSGMGTRAATRPDESQET